MQVLLENIAEVNNAVAIQATGNHSAVHKNTKLILQAVTMERISLNIGIAVGPFKAFSHFNEDFIPDADAPGVVDPVTGDTLL